MLWGARAVAGDGTGDGGGRYLVRATFDNASFLVTGEDVSRFFDATFNDQMTVCAMTRGSGALNVLLFPLLLVLRRRRSGAPAA